MHHLLTPLARSGLAPSIVAVLTAPALAQTGASGSENHRAPARELAGAAGTAQSETFRAATAVAPAPAVGATSSSAGYRFRGGVTFVGEGFAPSVPVAFGVAGGGGSKDGGAVETVFGAGFQGGAAIAAILGGAPASGVTVLSDTELNLITPPGIDALGNPLGSADLELATTAGSSVAENAYLFQPALISPGELRVGQTYSIALAAEPGSLVDLYLGIPLPGFALPVAGVDGAFDLVAFYLSPASSAFTGGEPQVWKFLLPADPNLVGKALDWQGFAISNFAPLEGSFTNRLTTPIGG